MEQKIQWSENVIIVDGDFIDRVAFDLIVNFERMIGRRIPQADMARWLECMALDGGVREGTDQHTQAIFIHEEKNSQLENFKPGDYAADLHLKAFTGKLGEISIDSYALPTATNRTEYIIDVLGMLLKAPEVKRIMLAADDDTTARAGDALRYADDDKRITLFAMQPLRGGNYRSEILGYSLMSALGIRADEIPAE